MTFTGNVTNKAFDAYLMEMDKTLENLGPRVVIFDALASGRTPAYHRRRQAQWIRERMPLLRQGTVANLFVLASPVIRMVLASILWMQRMPWPYHVVPTVEEALEKAYKLLDQKGIDYTPMPAVECSTG